MRGLSILGDAVQKQGGKVFVTHDTGQMLRSPIMAMYKASVDISKSDKAKIRRVTEKYFNKALKEYQFSSIELSDLVNNQLMNEINTIIDEKTDDLRGIVFKGFSVGKMAEYDFILETKYPYSPKLSSIHKKLYSQYVKNTILAIAITDKICERYKPSLFLTFNEYAQCQAVRYSAIKHKVKCMSLTYPVPQNIDSSRFSIWKSSYDHWISKHSQRWNKWKNVPINEKYIMESWRDSIFRMYESGSHIFSARKQSDPVSIFNKLKLDPKRKTIVVYTSSQEERGCVKASMEAWGKDEFAVDAFSNQIEWLNMLKEYVTNRNDVQMVIRIHPREGSRQLGFDSQHLIQLKAKFTEDTPNFKIIWADDQISSYDLMELADVCLIFWSTMGQEAARLGIPVLSCVANLYYPNDDFLQTASTPEEYKKKLDMILKMDYKWKHLVKAIRFYHWRTFISSLDLSRTIPADFDDHSVWPKSPRYATGIINDILSDKENIIKYNLKKWKRTLSKNTENKEKEAVKKGIRYFLDKIFYPPKDMKLINRIWRYGWCKITGNYLWVPKDSFKDYHLKYIDDLSKMDDLVNQTKHNSKLRILMVDGHYAILINKGKVLRRMSPMAIRLAKLHENA